MSRAEPGMVHRLLNVVAADRYIPLAQLLFPAGKVTRKDDAASMRYDKARPPALGGRIISRGIVDFDRLGIRARHSEDSRITASI